MNLIITSDRGWRCDDLDNRVIGRLIARYGEEDLVIVHGEASGGVESAFENALLWARVTKDPHPAD